MIIDFLHLKYFSTYYLIIDLFRLNLNIKVN